MPAPDVRPAPVSRCARLRHGGSGAMAGLRSPVAWRPRGQGPQEKAAMRFQEFGGRARWAGAGSAFEAGGSAAALLHHRAAAESLAELSLDIVREARGPMRLWDFASRLRHRL